MQAKFDLAFSWVRMRMMSSWTTSFSKSMYRHSDLDRETMKFPIGIQYQPAGQDTIDFFIQFPQRIRFIFDVKKMIFDSLACSFWQNSPLFDRL